jgi:helicase HerA-like protein
VGTIARLGRDAAGPWYQVLAIAASGRPGSAEQDFIAILPAVLSAAQRGRPFVIGWLSRGGGAPLELITNAGPLPAGEIPDPAVLDPAVPDPAGPAPAGGLPPGSPVRLLFPGDGRGAPAAGRWLTELDRMVWAPCPGRQAPPLGPPGPGEPSQDPGAATAFESTLVTLMARPFGWLVVAEPTDQMEAEIADLRTHLNVLRRHDEEQSRFDAERAQRRLTELDTFREAGLWNVRVLAGAASAAELDLLAPVLVGSADLGRHPYRLRATAGAQSLADALTAKIQDPRDGAHVPFAVTAGVLTTLAGLPRREVPGLRVLDAGYFDLTSETGHCGHGNEVIELGAILDGQDRPVGGFRVPLSTLNRHAFVTGATGSGKSQTVRHMLEQLTRAGRPWLAIEPVKSEYAAMAGRLAGPGQAGQAGQVTVINPSDPGAVPLSVNPLAPEPGYPVQAHIDMVRALFMAAFDAEEPFPQIMSQALQRVYEASGWDVVTGGGTPGALTPPPIPTLAQLQRAALAVIEDVGYGSELQADVRGFVDVRLRSLRIGSAGRFFEGGHPADVGELLRRNVVLAIEDVANDEDKAFLMGTLIIRIVEHLRVRARRGRLDGLRHVIVIEEAHRLLRAGREGRASGHAVELFASMLAEIRAYGEGIVVAEQIPAKLVPDVVKNTALKVVHRLPARDDRDVVGAAMNLDDAQSRQVVSLEPGVAAVFADGMDRPLRIRVPFGGGREEVLAGPPPPVLGRRSAACGPRCTGERACSLLELRTADLLADPASADDVWLRVWAEALVLAFLTNRELPAAPARLQRRWAGLGGRLRECLLATVVDRVTGNRALAVRASYDSQRLAASVAAVALRMLDDGTGAGTRAGPGWVIPQVRWLHEIERVCPLRGRAPDALDLAPPLDFDLPGIADWPDMCVGHRLRALRRHPLSMGLARNRAPAWSVLLGDDDQQAFTGDLAGALIGVGTRTQVRQAGGAMGITAWLDVVLSWPRRFIADHEQWVAGTDECGPDAVGG